MPDYWITTHWPIPVCEPLFSRHVYVKDRHLSLPQPGAFVFIRESIDAKNKNRKPIRTATRHHRGHKAQFDVPKGTGGIIGTATVSGELRAIGNDDVVFDFGDLPEWSIVPCVDFQPASLPLKELKRILDKQNLQFLNLWEVDDDALGEKLLKALRR